MKLPETRYARSGDVRIAYQVVGQGPLDLVFVPGFISNLDVHWEDPGFTHLLTRLSAFTRLILLDKRGTGLSDRVDNRHLPNLETRMDDVRAVMDAAGSQRAALLGASEGGPMSILFAATYPERTRALVLYGAYAHFHTWVMGREALEEFIKGVEKSWGTGVNAIRFAPDQVKDGRFDNWWGRYERSAASPNAAIALARMNAAIDVRPVVGSIRVPTLVIHRREDARIKYAGGEYLAAKIKGAKFVTMTGRDHPIWTGDVDPIVDEIEEFLTGVRPSAPADRVLSTVLIARLVSPARLAVRFGDRNWNIRLDMLHAQARDIIARFGGRAPTISGEEISAHFDGPARAVRCAAGLREAAHALEIALSQGVHTGEIEIRGETIGGLTVHVTERIAAVAGVDEILISGVVSDLVAGAGLHFTERPEKTIDGVDHPMRLSALATEQHLEPASRHREERSIQVLSAREREVLSLVAEGLSNPAIGDQLKLSEHTIKRHVANILLKLDLPSRAAAAALIARERPRRGL